MIRKLLLNDGRAERELVLKGTIVVGRDPSCHINDLDPLLSRRHAEFVAGPDGAIVRDLGSRNGILVNGNKVPQVLKPGDIVRWGLSSPFRGCLAAGHRASGPGARDDRDRHGNADDGAVAARCSASNASAAGCGGTHRRGCDVGGEDAGPVRLRPDHAAHAACGETRRGSRHRFRRHPGSDVVADRGTRGRGATCRIRGVD